MKRAIMALSVLMCTTASAIEVQDMRMITERAGPQSVGDFKLLCNANATELKDSPKAHKALPKVPAARSPRALCAKYANLTQRVAQFRASDWSKTVVSHSVGTNRLGRDLVEWIWRWPESYFKDSEGLRTIVEQAYIQCMDQVKRDVGGI